MYSLTKKNEIIDALVNIIDEVVVSDESLEIKTSKNILINSNGNVVFKSRGHTVFLSGLLHLNPSIDFDKPEDFDKLDYKLLEDIKDKMGKLLGVNREELDNLIEKGEVKIPELPENKTPIIEKESK